MGNIDNEKRDNLILNIMENLKDVETDKLEYFDEFIEVKKEEWGI